MASLRELARNHYEEAAMGVCWMALWKTGKSWNLEAFYPMYDEHRDLFEVDEDDRIRLREILSEDYGAQFINGVYCNIGPLEEMTVQSLTDGLRFQYERGRHTMLCDCI